MADVQKRTTAQGKVSYSQLDADVVFAFSHPSESSLEPFLGESLHWHGAGVIGIDHRYIGRDHELDNREAANDIARVLSELVPSDRPLFLVGHSEGAPLMGLVQTMFRRSDGIVFLAPHISRAETLEAWIDPSIGEDEQQDPSISMYSDALSFPLSRDFVDRYRVAQRARVQRLAKCAADLLLQDRGDERMAIPGTCADPRFCDRSLDPNQRSKVFPLGDPASINRERGFVADGVTARAFFDQWYRPTCSADLLKLAPYLDLPVLSVAFGADGLVFPSQTLRLATSLPARSTVWTLDGAMHNPKDQPDHLDALARKMLSWATHLS